MTKMIYARDSAGRVFQFNPESADVRKEKRGHPEDVAGWFDDLYFFHGQWFHHAGPPSTLAPPPTPIYATFFTQEQARDWFLVNGKPLPGELADLRPADKPTPCNPQTQNTPKAPIQLSLAEAIDHRAVAREREAHAKLREAAGDVAGVDSIPDWNELITSPPLPATKIAEKLGQPVELVERVLRHQRKVQPFCFAVDDSPQKGQARYLHKMPDVIPALKMWMEKRRKKRSNAST